MKKISYVLKTVIIFLLIVKLIPNVQAIYEEYFKIDQQYELKQLIKDDPVWQTFNPSSDFGSIEVKFDFDDRRIIGNLLFILKENERIIYSNEYPFKKITQAVYFPFGFPKVRVKKNNRYKFGLMVKKIDRDQNVYVWLDKQGSTNYIVSGERPIPSSIIYYFTKNIENDPLFFLFYISLLVFITAFFFKYRD